MMATVYTDVGNVPPTSHLGGALPDIQTILSAVCRDSGVEATHREDRTTATLACSERRATTESEQSRQQ